MAYGNYAPFYRGGYFNPMQAPTMTPMVDNQNQFGQQYQPPVQQQQVAPIANQLNDMMLWVLGQTEAESYPVVPNNTVILWDKNEPTIYIKSVNMQGVPSMRILDFTERAVNAPKTTVDHVCQCGDKFATKEQLNALQGKFDDVMAIVEDLQTKSNSKSTKSTKKTEDE